MSEETINQPQDIKFLAVSMVSSDHVFSADEVAKAPSEFAFEMQEYNCFAVRVKSIAFDIIQKILEQAFIMLTANPQYLFVSEQDRELFVAPHKGVEGQKIVQLTNTVTGRMMHIVTLPELEPGKLLFGFMGA
jgi:hypothetical protein